MFLPSPMLCPGGAPFQPLDCCLPWFHSPQRDPFSVPGFANGDVSWCVLFGVVDPLASSGVPLVVNQAPKGFAVFQPSSGCPKKAFPAVHSLLEPWEQLDRSLGVVLRRD